MNTLLVLGLYTANSAYQWGIISGVVFAIMKPWWERYLNSPQEIDF